MRAVIHIAMICVLSFGVSLCSYAQLTASDFDSMTEAFNKEFESLGDSGRASVESVEAEYDQIQAQIAKEYDSFQQEVCDMWGEKSATVSDRYHWVEYGDDKKSRSVVDFESGTVEVEILLTDEELKDASLVEAKIESTLQKLAVSKGSSVEFDSQYIPKEEVSSSPIMDDIIDIRATNIVRDARSTTVARDDIRSDNRHYNDSLEQVVISLRAEADALAPKPKEVAQTQTQTQPQSPAPAPEAVTSSVTTEPKAETTAVQTVKAVETTEGTRNVVTVKTSFKVGYLGDLAKRYETMVLSNAERFDISPTLIFAIMETESYFNPLAVSHVPAYGLMQIVPKYAGRDVYRYLYGEDKILSKNYLCQAEKNVEIGTGFLKLLSSRYFKDVKDQRCKELCMIAAYNTGPGNVSRAIVGHTNVFKSIADINAMSYDKLYAHLRKNLPYEETRSYIEKVTTKRQKYIAK